MRKLWLPMLLISALLLLGAACDGGGPTPTPVPPTPTATPIPQPTATPTPSGAATPSAAAKIPDEFKGVASAMASIKSVKFKMSAKSTVNGTPVPESEMMGMAEVSGELDLANNSSHVKFGEMESITIGNVTYTKFGADAEWMKTEMEPGEEPEAQFVPEEEDFATLSQIEDLGTEPCNSGMCRVYSAIDTQDTQQSTMKFYIGVSDNLIHKASGEQTDSQGMHTTFTMEFYDYNKPVSIEAPM